MEIIKKKTLIWTIVLVSMNLKTRKKEKYKNWVSVYTKH